MAKVTEGIPIANFSFSKEDLQEIVDEKVKEIELDIQAIRNKAIDDFTDKIKHEFKVEVEATDDELDWIDEIAQQLKDGGKNENTADKLS